MNGLNQTQNESQEFGQDSFEKDEDLVDEDFNNNFKIEGQKSLIQQKKSEEMIRDTSNRNNQDLQDEKSYKGFFIKFGKIQKKQG